jgi:predicted dehydrogenase
MRLLILGTGGMARAHAGHFSEIEGVEVIAGVDTNAERLAAFADNHGIEHRFTSLDAALDWGDFDAVANVTPDPVHHPTTLSCLAAGKNVFCEKPLALNAKDAFEMTEAQEKAGLIGMVNLTYRNFAPIQKAREMIAAGELGTIRHVEASYLQSWLTQPAWGHWDKEDQWLWRLSTAHGSHGVLGDVGVHIIDFATFGIGLDITSVSSKLQTFHKADGDRIGDYVLDANDSFTMQAEFNNGALGVIHSTRWASGHLNDLKLRAYGERGGIEVGIKGPESWLKASLGENMLMGKWVDIDTPDVPTNYQKFAAAVRTGKQNEPSFRRAAEVQKVLDAALQSDKEGHPVALT